MVALNVPIAFIQAQDQRLALPCRDAMWVMLMRQWARYRTLFKILFFAVLGLGIYLGMTPAPPAALPGWNAYLYHAGGLFACTVLNFLAFPRWYWWVRGLLMFLVGVAVEYVQSFHPTRSADITDIYANTGGVLVGLVLVWGFQWWRRSRHQGSAPLF